jgi:hypothetical protein
LPLFFARTWSIPFFAAPTSDGGGSDLFRVSSPAQRDFMAAFYKQGLEKYGPTLVDQRRVGAFPTIFLLVHSLFFVNKCDAPIQSSLIMNDNSILNLVSEFIYEFRRLMPGLALVVFYFNTLANETVKTAFSDNPVWSVVGILVIAWLTACPTDEESKAGVFVWEFYRWGEK